MDNSQKSDQKINHPKIKIPFGIGIWILIITFIRLAYVGLNQRPLGIDEAQYWTWAQHLAWGYHSKSPMIAWALWAAQQMNGVGLFAVRFLSPVTYAVSSLMVYFSAERLFQSHKVGFYSALIFLLLPGVTFSASIISTDPFLIMFWSIALFNFIDGVQNNTKTAWISCGVAVGLGFLSKYTMGVCVLSFGLFLIFSKRETLKTSGPYLALIFGFLVLLPNLIWNAQNHWVTFVHVGSHNLDWSEAGWHWGSLGNFMGSQFAIAGPLVLIFFLFALTRFEQLKKHPEAYLLLIWQIVPLLLGIMIEAVISHAYANWAAPIYLAISIFVAGEMLEKKSLEKIKTVLLILAIGINILLGLCLYSYELAYQHGVHLIKKDPFYLNRPWPTLGQALMSFRFEHWNANYLFDDRAVLSETMFYLRLDPGQVYSFNPNGNLADQYDLTTKLKLGDDYILITRDKNSKALKFFSHVNLINTIDIFSNHQEMDFYVYELIGYQR